MSQENKNGYIQLRCPFCNKRLLDINSPSYAITTFCSRCKTVRAFSNIAHERQNERN